MCLPWGIDSPFCAVVVQSPPFSPANSEFLTGPSAPLGMTKFVCGLRAMKNATRMVGSRSIFYSIYLLYQSAMGDWDMLATFIFGMESSG
jgi:hypothetical protein